MALAQDKGVVWDTGDPNVSTCIDAIVFRITPHFLLLPLMILDWRQEAKAVVVPTTCLLVSRILAALVAAVLLLVESIHVSLSRDWDSGSPVVICGQLVATTCHMLVAILLCHFKCKRRVRSGSVWIFAATMTLIAGVRLYLAVDGRLPADGASIVVTSLYFPVITLFLVLCSVADRVDSSTGGKMNPRDVASIPSYFTFNWVNRLALTGWRRELGLDDLHPVAPQNRAHELGSRFRRNLFRKEDRLNVTSFGVAVAIAKTFRKPLLLSGVLKLLIDVMDLTKPLLLKWLLLELADQRLDRAWHCYVIVFVMLITLVVYNVVQNLYLDICFVTGIRIRTAVTTCIYEKSLTLSHRVRDQKSVGQVVNLMSKDADQFRQLMEKVHMVWAVFVQLTVAHTLLYQEIGWSAFTGLLILLLATPVNALITRCMKRAQKEQMRHKDDRIRNISDIIRAIKTIKLHVWEEAFEHIVLHIRDLEMRHIRIVAYCSSMQTFAWNMTPVIVTVATFTVFLTSDSSHFLDPEKIFFCITVFNILRLSYKDLPKLLSYLNSSVVACHRLADFFAAPEQEQRVARDRHMGQTAVEIRGAVLVWNRSQEEKKFALRVHEMTVAKGSFVAVVGKVGSGKSALLSALLDETDVLQGTIRVCSSSSGTGLVSQQAVVLNDTVRNNILFGRPMQQQKYAAVLEACQLEQDMVTLPAGDETEVGEKGITLSGGQRQRVGIARACYSDADLILMDDPLSAVDSHVARRLLCHVLSSESGLLRHRTRIVVTNNFSLLPHVDRVFVADGGRIVDAGSFCDFKSDSKFHEWLTEQGVAHKKRGPSHDPSLSSPTEKVPEKGIVWKGSLVAAEEVKKGSVGLGVIIRYFREVPLIPLITCCFLLYQVCEASGTYWLSQWSDSVSSSQSDSDHKLAVYALLGLGSGSFLLTASMAFARGAVHASHRLHGDLLRTVLRAPMSFFETTPSGRILNRFAKDTDVIDVNLLDGLTFLIVVVLQLVAAFLMILVAVPAFAIPLIPLTGLFVLIQRINMGTARQVRRLDSMTASLVYCHLAESLSAVSCIRVFGQAANMQVRAEELVDRNQRCTLCVCEMNRWRCVRLQLLGNLTVFLTAGFAVLWRDSLHPGLTGLAVSSAIQVSGLLNWLVKGLSGTETDAVSLERVLDYTDHVPAEGEWHVTPAPPATWPRQGRIAIVDYSTRYRPGLPLVLTAVRAEISSGQKVAVVGRTGAGKSSIALSLFRILEPVAGRILIDGLDIAAIGLHDLRTRVTLIPQEPVVVWGSVRRNLDPTGSQSDQRLWDSLRQAHISHCVQSLDEDVGHLSVGQQQLLCLSRALLRDTTRILLMDEPTASVDAHTERLIRTTVRRHFSHCTVLTIAHRLHGVLDADRVMVMSDGRVAEFACPHLLLNDPRSLFYALAADAGIILSAP